MAIPIDVLRNLKKSWKCWYIVADMNVLMDDIHFLRSYIIGDPMCQLLTPIFILNKIEAMCNSDQRERFIATKRSIEQLDICSRHVRFDDEVEEGNSLKNSFNDIYDVILKCCLQLMSHDFHVVLVTKSNGLRTLAEIRGVHVYNLEEIKTGALKNKVNIKKNIIVSFTDKKQPPLNNTNRYRCIRFASRLSNRYTPHPNRFFSTPSNHGDYCTSNLSNYNRQLNTSWRCDRSDQSYMYNDRGKRQYRNQKRTAINN